MQNDTEIHGHAVLEMMASAGREYSRESLLTAIREQFGEDARFFICSGSGLSAAQLVDALAAKGKFVGRPDAFRFDPQRMCRH